MYFVEILQYTESVKNEKLTKRLILFIFWLAFFVFFFYFFIWCKFNFVSSLFRLYHKHFSWLLGL